MPANKDDKTRRNVATLVALIGLLATGVAILGLVMMVLGPAVSVIILVTATMIGIGALQYVTWGWKLDRDQLRDEGDERQVRD